MNAPKALPDPSQAATIEGRIEPASETVAHEVLPREARRVLRLGLLILLIFFGVFMAWAALAPLDAGVPAPGVTIVESKRKTVAHLTGGIVREILVIDMQYVEEGQPLIVLDTTTASAQYQSALKEYYALMAVKARLEAERNDTGVISFPRELLDAGDQGDAGTHRQLQQALFTARRQALAAELRVLEETVSTYATEAAARREQLKLLEEQLTGMRGLAGEGYAPRNTLLEIERQALELRSRIELLERQAQDVRLRMRLRRNDYRKEVETQLAEVSKQATIFGERVAALKEELDRNTVRSPATGYINALAVHTVGGVVRPGEPLMEIVPKDERLVFEVQIPSHHIDRVHAGQMADIQLANFYDLAGVTLEGKVLSVSADLVVDRAAPVGGAQVPPHYLARIELTDRGLATLGPRRSLQAGMQVTVLIKTGERTFFEYLLKPITERLHTAVKEP